MLRQSSVRSSRRPAGERSLCPPASTPTRTSLKEALETGVLMDKPGIRTFYTNLKAGSPCNLGEFEQALEAVSGGQ